MVSDGIFSVMSYFKLSAMPKQEKFIKCSEWKVLIIFDALRYDYFKCMINKMDGSD